MVPIDKAVLLRVVIPMHGVVLLKMHTVTVRLPPPKKYTHVIGEKFAGTSNPLDQLQI